MATHGHGQDDESLTIPLRSGRDFSLYNPPANNSSATYSHPSGVQVPGYEIIAEVGRGGMGVVFEARDVRLNRLVALKMVLTGEFTSHQEAERFRAEADAVAQLQHQSIVQVYEVGEAAGRPYMAMEFVGGGTLAKRAADEPQPVEASAEIVELLARALHAAHQRGVLHRDLKPSNVLLLPVAPGQGLRSAPYALSHFGWPKITDFGLAKRLDNDEEASQSHTLMGTPAYMAPEQTAASQATGPRLGPATDVYGLGAILYELLTGRPPFAGGSPMDTLLQVRSLDPIPPSYWSPRLPKDIETICLKCLEKDPRRRYATAEALADDLRRFLDGQPIQARPIGTMEKATKWAKRRPAVAALLATCVFLTIGGFSGVLWQWRDAETERANAQSLAQKESDARQIADRRRLDAEQSRERAARAEDLVRAELARSARSLYVSRINNSRLHWQSNNTRGALLELAASDEKYRGLEWNLLHRRYNSELWSMQFDQCAQKLAPSSDGQRLFIATGDPSDFSWSNTHDRAGELICWDLVADRPQWVRSELTASLRHLALSPRDRWLAVVGANHVMHLHEAGTGELMTCLDDVTGQPAFHPTEPILAIPRRGSIRIVNVESRETVAEWPTINQYNAKIVFSPDGRALVSHYYHPTRMEVRDAKTGRVVKSATAPGLATISPDGRWLVGQKDREVIEYRELPTDWLNLDGLDSSDDMIGRLIYRLNGHNGPVQALCFSPDGRYLASGGNDTTVRIWNLSNGHPVTVCRGHDTGISDVRFSPCGQYVMAAAEYSHRVKIWDMSRDPLMATVANSPVANVEALAITPDGKELFALGLNGNMMFWNVANGHELGRYWIPTFGTWQSPSCRAAFDRAVTRIAASTGNLKDVGIYDVRTGRELAVLRGHNLAINGVAFSPDGQWLVTSAFTTIRQGRPLPGEVILWDLNTHTIRRRWVDLPHRFYSLAFSPDSRELLAGGGFPHDGDHGVMHALVIPDGEWQELARPSDRATPTMADAPLPEPLPQSVAASEFVNAIAWHPGGGVFAAAQYRGNTVGIWHLDTAADGQRVARLRQPIVTPARIYSLAYSNDGQRLIGAGRDGIRIWDPATGQELLHLRGAGVPSGDPGFNPQLVLAGEGRGIAANNWNGAISFWSADPLNDKTRPAERSAAQQRAVDHRLQTAEQAINEFRWDAVEHHLGAVHGQVHDAARIHRAFQFNGRIHHWSRTWELAQRYLALAPNSHRVWFEAAPVALKRGGADGYREYCAKMCAELPDDLPAWVAAQYVLNCFLTESPAGDPKVIHHWRIRAGQDPRLGQFLAVIEAAEHLRHDRWEQSLESAARALLAPPADDYINHYRGRIYMMMALAQARLNRIDEARQTADRAAQWQKTVWPDQRGALWYEQLALELLNDELMRIILEK